LIWFPLSAPIIPSPFRFCWLLCWVVSRPRTRVLGSLDPNSPNSAKWRGKLRFEVFRSSFGASIGDPAWGISVPWPKQAGIFLFLDGAGEAAHGAASGAGARPCNWAQGGSASATAEASGLDAAYDAHTEVVASGLHAFVSNSLHNLKSRAAVCSRVGMNNAARLGRFEFAWPV
jgi:hypothetical protein